MATVGSLAFAIIANHKDFKEGITASRAELKSLRAAFLDTQKPVERFSGAIQHLEMLMAKFPTRANELRASIHSIRREMDAARFAQGARNEAGFMADLDAGLARNRARNAAFQAAQIPGGAGGSDMFRSLINQSKVARASLIALHSGSITPLMVALAATGPAGGLVGAAVAAGAALAALATKSLAAADAARQSREEFFKQVDALKAIGGDTSFADSITRVKSLSTAWKEARDSLDGYLAAFAEQSGIHSPVIGGLTAASASFSTLRGGTESVGAAIDRELENRARKRIEEEQKNLEISKQFAAQELKVRQDNARRAYEIQRDRFNKEARDELAAARETMSKTAALRERLRTPGERLRRELNEIMGLPLDGATRLRALEELRGRAEGMMPDTRTGDPRLSSMMAIRAGSVEALRAQFPGGSDKVAKAAEKTAKNTEGIKEALGKIETAIRESGGVGVAE